MNKTMVAAACAAALGVEACAREAASPAPALEQAPEFHRYAITAVFDGKVAVFGDGTGVTEVGDRFEIVAHWNERESRLEGEPILANFGSKLVPLEAEAPGCTAPVRTTVFELATITDIAAGSGRDLQLTIERALSGGEVEEDCKGPVRAIDAKIETDIFSLALPHPDLLANADAAIAAGYRVANDRLVQERDDGWTITVSVTREN